MSAPSSTEPSAAPKKSKKKLIIIFALVLLIVGGGGGGFLFYKRAIAATPETAEKSKKSKAADNEEESEEEGSDGEESKEEGEESEGSHEEDSAHIDDSEVKQIIELQPFIVNLADKDEARYLRLTVNVGVGESEGGEGGEKGKVDPLFTTRVRNAMLAVLTTKTSDEVLSAEGKNTLRKELLKATRKASEEPQVHAIYITDFIVQL